MYLALAVVAGVAASCSARPARFAARPPVEEARDQLPGPLPQRHRILEPLYLTHVYLKRPIMWGLTASRPHYAQDVNSFDRVPDSTWYVQRPGGLQVRADYVRQGPPVPPLSAGVVTDDGTLRVRDARGRPYELVLDPHAKPESVTAAGAVSSRIFFALGYRTEESHVVRVSLSSFSAKYKDVAGRFLAQRTPWGRTRNVRAPQRVLAIATPRGIDLGNTQSAGTREGDVNDVVEAEDRRTLRALGTFAWWLGVRGIGRFYTRDYYVGKAGKGHALHYVVGLQNSLKATSLSSLALRADPNQVHGDFLKNLYSFGFAEQPPAPVIVKEPLRQYSKEPLPDSFSPIRPYDPLDHQLPSDAYWAAKKILEVEPSTLGWAVNNAQLSDDRLARALAKQLERRGRDLARKLFALATPVEIQGWDDDSFDLVDLTLVYGLVKTPAWYRITFVDEEGEEVSRFVRRRVVDGVLTVPLPSVVRNYLVVRVSRLGDDVPPPAEFHFRMDGKVRLIGVRH